VDQRQFLRHLHHGRNIDYNPHDIGTIFVVNPAASKPLCIRFSVLSPTMEKPARQSCAGEGRQLLRDDQRRGTNDDGNDGIIFRVNPVTGLETNLYSFGSYTNDGINPLCALVLGNDGNFYGTTSGEDVWRRHRVPDHSRRRLYESYSFGGTPPMETGLTPAWCWAATAISTEQPRGRLERKFYRHWHRL